MDARNFWFFFGGIWLAVGIPFLAIGAGVGWYELTLEKRLAERGASAPALVLVKSWRTNGDGGERSYQVEYRFATEGGETVKAEADVSESVWDALREQETIPVSYLPDWPRTNRIDGRVVGWLLPSIFGTLGFILTTLGGFVVLKARAMSQRRS